MQSSAHPLQPSVNLLVEMEVSALNPTSVSVRKASQGLSVRKESEVYKRIGTKMAFWTTSLT